MSPRILPIVAAAATVFLMIDLLRRHQLREKYAVLWLAVSFAVVVIALFPSVLATGARVTGVQTPSNLLFFIAALVLLVVCVQLSWEVSRLEDETRALAEEVAILRLEAQRAQVRPSEQPNAQEAISDERDAAREPRTDERWRG